MNSLARKKNVNGYEKNVLTCIKHIGKISTHVIRPYKIRESRAVGERGRSRYRIGADDSSRLIFTHTHTSKEKRETEMFSSRGESWSESRSSFAKEREKSDGCWSCRRANGNDRILDGNDAYARVFILWIIRVTIANSLIPTHSRSFIKARKNSLSLFPSVHLIRTRVRDTHKPQSPGFSKEMWDFSSLR